MPSRLDPAQRYEDALAAIERLLAERAVLVEEQEAEPLAIAAAQTLVAEIEREVRIAEETLSAAMESMVAQGLKPTCPDERQHLANLRERRVNERSSLDRLMRDAMERRRRLGTLDQDLDGWRRRRDQAFAAMGHTEIAPVSG